MDITSALNYFKNLEATLNAYTHATNLLYFDGVTTAPAGSAEGRGKTMGILAGIEYDLTSSPETIDNISFLMEHR